ncbi:MAG: Spy/CpxP family protein refolding chaperone [Blastocatellia bacterium]
MRLTFCVLCILLLTFGLVRAQQQPQPDPFAGNLFPPELIMQHQQTLGLSEEQKNFLEAELRKTQTRLTELQWGLQDEVEKLAALVKTDQVDESGTLTQLDKVLGLEREIKLTQIGLLIRIKSKLTPEQLARLNAITGKTRGK